MRKPFVDVEPTGMGKEPKAGDMPQTDRDNSLRDLVLARVQSNPDAVWTAADFADLASRASVDKALQRLAKSGDLRRIDRGLYDRPRRSALTGRPNAPDYRAVMRSRDAIRFACWSTA